MNEEIVATNPLLTLQRFCPNINNKAEMKKTLGVLETTRRK